MLRKSLSLPMKLGEFDSNGSDIIRCVGSPEARRNLSVSSSCSLTGRDRTRNSSLVLIVLFALIVGRVDSQCNTIVVADAKYQDNVDGTYLLYVTCNGQSSWVQQLNTQESNDEQPINYVYYVGNGSNGCIGTACWYIGTQNCAVGSTVQVLAKAATLSTTYPYNIPLGNWQEINGHGYVYTSLTVSCSRELTSLQIAFIVCGCIFVFVAGLLTFICFVKIRQRRRRMMTSQQTRQQRDRHNSDAISVDSVMVPPGVSIIDGVSYVTQSAYMTDAFEAFDSRDVMFGGDLFLMTAGALPIEPPLYTTVVDYYGVPPPPYE